jgi:hypothetical protein
MGVTIYYRGVFRHTSEIREFIDEVCDIATTNQWEYQVLDDSWDQPVSIRISYDEEGAHYEGNSGLKGVILNPHPELDSFTLLFDSDGVCRPLVEMTETTARRHGVSHLSTQDAGVEIHMEMIHFLEYIGNRYMKEWSIEDDSGYFTHREAEKARQVFEAVGDAIDAVTEAFDSIEMPEDLAGKEEEFLDMVEQRIRTYLPGVEIRRVSEDEEE